MILNSIEKPQQKQPNQTQKRSRHNSTSKQSMPQPLTFPKQPYPQAPPKQKTNQNQQFLRWIKQIYKNKSIKQQLIKKSQEHADDIYHLQRNINKLQLYRDQLNKKIQLLTKQQIHEDSDVQDDIIMERTYFQESGDRIDVSRQRIGGLENDGIGSDNAGNMYLV